jgi:hypothetical protein
VWHTLNRRKVKLWKIRRPSANNIHHGMYMYPSIPVLVIGNMDVEGTGGRSSKSCPICPCVLYTSREDRQIMTVSLSFWIKFGLWLPPLSLICLIVVFCSRQQLIGLSRRCVRSISGRCACPVYTYFLTELLK